MRKEKFDAGTLKAIIALVIMVALYAIQVVMSDRPIVQQRHERNVENWYKQEDFAKKHPVDYQRD